MTTWYIRLPHRTDHFLTCCGCGRLNGTLITVDTFKDHP
jgi:hypothetical protein